MNRLVYFDSGTSNTRLFLVEESGEVRHVAKKHVGSRDSAIAGSNRVLIDGLWELYSAMLDECGLRDADIGAIYASGMITSPFGLHEVPHLEFPLTLEKYAASLVPFRETVRFGRDIVLVPGGKTVNADFTFVNNTRGEEIEAVGVLDELGPQPPGQSVAVLFPGSHTHTLLLRGEALAGILSQFTGELFEALRKETILAPILNAKLESHDPEMVRMAVRNLAAYGFNRSLYIGHAMQIFRENTPERRRSYVEGVLAGGVGQALAGYCRDQWRDCRKVAVVAEGPIADLYETILDEAGVAPERVRLRPDPRKSYGLKGLLRLLKTGKAG